MKKINKNHVEPNPCGHKLLSYKMGYIEHMNEMEKRNKAGQYQTQCKKCLLFLFSDESDV